MSVYKFKIFLIIFLGLLGSVVRASEFKVHPLDAFNNPQSYTEMEKNLNQTVAADPELKSEAIVKARALAETYLKNGRPQEAIWAYEKGGLYQDSERLAQQIQTHLETKEIVMGVSLQGVSQPSLAKIGSISVVIKNADQSSSIESELWAYQLDRILGLNIVPLVIQREINGVRKSVHLFLEGSNPSGFNFIFQRYQKENADIHLLDFLTGQYDRHANNSLISVSGKWVAIDHGRINGSDGTVYSPEKIYFPPELIPEQQILKNVQAMDPAILFSLMKNHSNPEVAAFISSQFEKAQKALPIFKADGKLRPITPGGRINPDFADSELRQIKSNALQFRDKEFLQKLKSLDELSPSNDIKKGVGFTLLSKNGQQFYQLIEFNKTITPGRYSAEILDQMHSHYNKQTLTEADVQSLFFSLLNIDANDIFIKKVTFLIPEFRPLHQMFTEEKFVQSYLNAESYSKKLVANYKKLRAQIGSSSVRCEGVFL